MLQGPRVRCPCSFCVCLGQILAWIYGSLVESKAVTKIAREERDCASQLSVIFILVARKRLHRENGLLFPFHESRESRKKIRI